MTTNDRLERELAAWFVETAVPRTPEFTDDILRQTAALRQRPRWTFPERWLPMSVTTLGRQALRPVPWRTVGLLAALLLLLGVAAVLYVGSQRRVPPPFGLAGNGRIAFVQTAPGYSNQIDGYHEPFGDILAVDPSTGATETLVGGPQADGEPVFSLDGTRLSFVRQVPGGVALYAVDSLGGSLVRLTADPLAGIREAAWSPDGRSIAFTVPSESWDGSDLWIAATDGSGAAKVDLGDLWAVAPQWRPPDGRELLFVGSDDPGLRALGAYRGIYGDEGATGLGLYRVRPDGTGLQALTPGNGTQYDYGSTSWTPDGQRIVTQRAGEYGYQRVVVLDADGAQHAQILPSGTLQADTMAPAVSPDGTRLAYAEISADRWRLHVRPIDGSGTDVTTDHEFLGAGAAFRWSPDGRLLIVNQHYYLETWLIDPDGGPARQASWTDAGYTAWQRLAR
jgi:Tol biopolymer transport system component